MSQKLITHNASLITSSRRHTLRSLRPNVLDILQRLFEIFLNLVGHRFLLAQSVEDARMRVLNEAYQLRFECAHVSNRYIVGVAIVRGPDDQHLFLYIHWLVLRLLQNFSQAFAERELRLRSLIQIRSELR